MPSSVKKRGAGGCRESVHCRELRAVIMGVKSIRSLHVGERDGARASPKSKQDRARQSYTLQGSLHGPISLKSHQWRKYTASPGSRMAA